MIVVREELSVVGTACNCREWIVFILLWENRSHFFVLFCSAKHFQNSVLSFSIFFQILELSQAIIWLVENNLEKVFYLKSFSFRTFLFITLNQILCCHNQAQRHVLSKRFHSNTSLVGNLFIRRKEAQCCCFVFFRINFYNSNVIIHFPYYPFSF